MKFTRRGLKAGALVLAGLAAGALLLALQVANRATPSHEPASGRVPTLAVIEAQRLPFRLEARGHGSARPARSWQAVASVAGRVVQRHPKLESGAIIEQGALLLELDPSRYRLAVAAAEAELARLSAEQDRLDTEAQNTERLLALERERLQLAEQELSRIERLADSGAVSRSQRDQQRRTTLAQRQAVRTLENQLRLIPARRKHLAAQREQGRTRLEQAREDLADTRIIAPYDLRVDHVDVELHQHVAARQTLFSADGIEAAEVEAHVPVPMLRRLMAAVIDARPEASALELVEHEDFSAIEAEVELVGVEGVRWPARLVRIASGLDPATRTARVVVRVAEPYRDANPPQRPPLQREIYTRVRLSAASPEPLLVLPATAVHDGVVYLADAEDRLRHRAVQVAFMQRDLAVIGGGLAAGERVIVDDPMPAVDGMKIDPRRDESRGRQLRRQAAGSDS